jgi:DNA-binding Lrp family transcriptional regulator
MKALDSTWQVLDNLELIEVILENPDSFVTFMGQQKSISQASKDTHLKLNAMAYRVKRLEHKGLITACGIEKKHGREMKTYTACSKRLFIPLDQTPKQTLEALFEHEGNHLERLINKSIIKVKEQLREEANSKQWGIRLYLDEQGEVQGDLAFSPEEKLELDASTAPALVDIVDLSFKLDFADAKKLQKELQELEQKYKRKPGGQNYIFRVALVPCIQLP